MEGSLATPAPLSSPPRLIAAQKHLSHAMIAFEARAEEECSNALRLASSGEAQ